MVFFAFFKLILERELNSNYEAFKAEFHKILVGAFTLPINFPGTSYYQGMQVNYQGLFDTWSLIF